MIDQILATIGSIIIVFSWIPQLVKLLRTRSSKDISLPFLVIIILGTVMLIPHAFVIRDIYFILLNILASSMASIVLVFSVIFRKRRR